MITSIEKEISKIPFFHSYNASQKKVKLVGATILPRELWHFKEFIDILEANDGELSKLDSDFADLGLKAAFFCRNNFSYTPAPLFDSNSIEILAFYENDLEEIPEKTLSSETRWLMISNNKKLSSTAFLKDIKKIRKLAALNCSFKELDPAVAELTELEFFRCGLNQFQNSIIDQLAELPKLAWFSDSENPYSYQPSSNFDAFAKFNEQQFLQRSPLDKGNRSSIEKVDIEHYGTYVLKTYNNSLSSDGSTFNEILTAFMIGSECDATSKTVGSYYHNQELKGIVQEIIPSDFKKLGNVPNFDTITRDTFTDHLSLSDDLVCLVLKQVANACEYAFSKGISHGDVYAHNILANSKGNAKLIDWGAACIFEPKGDESAKREKIEVRAFGYLMDDLMKQKPSLNKKLCSIKNSCLITKSLDRPSFTEIKSILQSVNQ